MNEGSTLGLGKRRITKLIDADCYACEAKSIYHEITTNMYFCLECGLSTHPGLMPDEVREAFNKAFENARKVTIN